jgi:hypothetical protein
MDISDQARERAIPLEVKKDGLQQKQNGDWVIKFVIAAAHMDERIARAPMGARYQAALVEVDDDEMPKHDVVKAKWAELGPVQQAVIRCGDPVFWAFLEEYVHHTDVNSKERCAMVVREHCGVTSRAHLALTINSKQRARWFQLDNAFQAWRIAEHG